MKVLDPVLYKGVRGKFYQSLISVGFHKIEGLHRVWKTSTKAKEYAARFIERYRRLKDAESRLQF